MKKYDIAIIGGGPGGYTAAVEAAKLGMNVCLVEKSRLGGTCLNTGCIPTKAFYRSAEIFREVNNCSEYGVESSPAILNMSKVIERKNSIVSSLVDGVNALMDSNKIDVYKGNASITDSKSIKVKSSESENEQEYIIEFENLIIATGSNPASISIKGYDLPGVMDSDGILSLEKIPKDLVVIGGGVIGVEFAGIFASFGSNVTILEFLPNILPPVDKEIRTRLIPIMKKNNIKVHTSTEVKEIIKEDSTLTVKANTKKGGINVPADCVLMAVGRVPNTDGLGLEKAGIKHTESGIIVDKNNQTSVPGVYAIGDVIGGTMLAHVASEEGISAIRHIDKLNAKEQVTEKEVKVVPACIFSFPEIAYVGITEDEAKEKIPEYKTGKFMFGANGKSLTLGENRGLVKVVTDKELKIIGVHILGPHASDLIHEGALAVQMGLRQEDIEKTIHAHPTLSEAFHEAVLDVSGMSINKITQGR